MDTQFRYDCNLNIEAFVHMLDDPTECYKFYWLDSIMQLIAENEESITFDKVISGMIADAWYSVQEYHLRMGTKDNEGKSVNSIERAIYKLGTLDCIEITTDRKAILDLIQKQDKLLHDEKYQISKNVPYRLLSSFIKEIDGNNPLWNQRRRLVAYFEMVNKYNCLLYTIGPERGLNKRIIIDECWKRFLIDNMVSIRGWIQMKKIQFLQARNPDVPGIIYKLYPENEKQRKLKNVRKLWAAILKIEPITDIYSGKCLMQDNYEIDHFIPWSYVTNDEIWNLIPVEASLNSSKRDRLPDWDKYFLNFAYNQFELNKVIYTYPKVRDLFALCQRDNLNSLWATENLYIENISISRFFGLLEDRLKPVYKAARMQGYNVWSF